MVELSVIELTSLNGGGWKEVGCAFVGTVGLAWSVPVAVLNPGAGLLLAGASLAALDQVF